MSRKDLTCDEICKILESTRGIPVSRLKIRELEIDFFNGNPVVVMEKATPSVEHTPIAQDPKDKMNAYEDEIADMHVSDPVGFENAIIERGDYKE
jgi:hypothetical protein